MYQYSVLLLLFGVKKKKEMYQYSVLVWSILYGCFVGKHEQLNEGGSQFKYESTWWRKKR